MNLIDAPCVISIGSIKSGVRHNIIPEEAELWGTIRTLDTTMQKDIHARIIRTVTNIAEANGAEADINIFKAVPINYNDPALTEKMMPILQAAAGANNVQLCKADTGAEDFALFSQKVPGMFFWLGGMPKGQDPETAPQHHTADFYIDESGMKLGVRALCYLAVTSW